MTEEKAKQKWCPMTRYADHDGGDSYNAWWNPTENKDGRCKCIASACMMWQEKKLEFYPEGGPKTEGFCGLAA